MLLVTLSQWPYPFYCRLFNRSTTRRTIYFTLKILLISGVLVPFIMGCSSSTFFLMPTQARVIFVQKGKITGYQEETESESTTTKMSFEIPKENEHFIPFADKDGTINETNETGSRNVFVVRSISLSVRKQTRQEKRSPHRSVSLSAWDPVDKMKRNEIPTENCPPRSTSLGQFGPCDSQDTAHKNEIPGDNN